MFYVPTRHNKLTAVAHPTPSPTKAPAPAPTPNPTPSPIIPCGSAAQARARSYYMTKYLEKNPAALGEVQRESV